MYANVPAPLPDECLRGYGFRVNATNGMDLLTTNQPLPKLSEASGLSIPHLITNHSHLAYKRFAYSAYGYLDLKNHPDLILNKNITACGTPVQNARYCPNCTIEDIDLYGISYWHRLHHLPGVDHCIKHDVSLINTNSHDCYTYQPFTSSTINSAIPTERLSVYFESLNIKKFSYLSAATLEMGLSFEDFVIRNTIINRYQRLKQGCFFDISDLVYKKFPLFWLNELFCGINCNERPAKLDKILEALKNNFLPKSIKTYLILMSLFWNDPSEAIRECLFTYSLRPLEDGRAYFLRNKYRTLLTE